MPRTAATVVILCGLLLNSLPGCARAAGSARSFPHFSGSTGGFRISFTAKTGIISIARKGKKASLHMRELSGAKKLNVLADTNKVKRSGSTWTLSGRSTWTDFTAQVSLPQSAPGLVHVAVTLKPRKDAPSIRLLPDVRLAGAPASSLKEWAPAPPVAGTSIFLSSAALDSSILYLADLTALGPYFERTNSGGSQSNFSYPRAGTDGSLVGRQEAAFGYVPPPASIGNLPHGKATRVIDSYLILMPSVPKDEASMSDTYLRLLGTVFQALPKPTVPVADWQALGRQAAADLNDPANWVTVGGKEYLRSYVSDTRAAPELITQAGVLAGVLAYEKRYGVTLPIEARLEKVLASFYDPAFHTVKNGLGRGGDPHEESWYYIGNLISLLQAAQNGSGEARSLLLDSAGVAVALAHVNGYEFPQNFSFTNLSGGNSGTQPDVAGGYAWLMLGLYDLTGTTAYLDEAKAAIAHIPGKGFDLTYETQMTGYAASAAQRLYSMTADATYHNAALLALTNLFHVTRLWDCTYGRCRTASGYHTYFGVNILPWGNYIAMLEQYGAWLGIREYAHYAPNDPAYLHVLVQAFISVTPSMMQYALPPRLPSGTVPSTPGLYDFVPHNNLGWAIPIEDLRTGETVSGSIGQEIYGAGGTFWFGAYAP